MPASPSPEGIRCKIQKNHKYSMGGGVGDSIHCGLQGQACSQHHTRTQNSQRYRLQKSIILRLTHKNKISGPQQTQSQRRLENQGQSHGKSQVKTGREQTEVGETQEGDSRDGPKTTRDSQKETARDRGSRETGSLESFKQCFQFNDAALRANVT